MSKLYIPVIVGTTRPKRQSIYAANFVYQVVAQNPEIETELIDPDDFNTPFDGNDEENKDPRYTEITARADGFIIVCPEYNHGYPGTLKRFLDSELQNYIHKPVMLAGVSAGPWGGVRAIEALVNVVRELGLVVTYTEINFPNVFTLFDAQGQITDDKYVDRVNRALHELLWMVKTLKWGRENLHKPE